MQSLSHWKRTSASAAPCVMEKPSILSLSMRNRTLWYVFRILPSDAFFSFRIRFVLRTIGSRSILTQNATHSPPSKSMPSAISRRRRLCFRSSLRIFILRSCLKIASIPSCVAMNTPKYLWLPTTRSPETPIEPKTQSGTTHIGDLHNNSARKDGLGRWQRLGDTGARPRRQTHTTHHNQFRILDPTRQFPARIVTHRPSPSAKMS